MKNEPPLDIHIETDQLLDLTQAMLTAATADDWDTFELREQQRSAMLKIVFSRTAEELAEAYLVDVIKKIQSVDKTITNLIIQQRDQAAEELRHLRRARESDKAYRVESDNLGSLNN